MKTDTSSPIAGGSHRRGAVGVRWHAAALVFASCLGGASALLPAEASAQSAAGVSAQERALKLFEEGRAAYREGRFADSVRLLREAHELVGEPVLLYNLARAHEGLGEFAEAIDAYERYLATAKDIPDRGAIETKLVSLRRELAERERLARERDEALERQQTGSGAARPSAPGDRADASGGLSPWPWVVAGLGGAVLVGGGVVGALALSANGDADAAPSQLEAAGLRDDAEGLATVSTVGFIAGGALLALGVTWAVIDLGSSDEPEPSRARLELGPAGATFQLSF